ncbi:hypothetical protein NUW58_g8389 [Xylaria curta]|uniref:Uncharacterized protein n=1 Tax=Xylaria curta TaxID=42375 RepID=A0ACC1N953_9PEZI|nr:hypothetical protein NUW58_g8389 [Xylaria curta]
MVYQDINIPLPAFIAIDFLGMTLALIPIILRFWLRWREAKPNTITRNISDGLIVLSWLSGLVLISINAWKNSLRQQYIHYPPDELYYSVPRHLSAHLLYVSLFREVHEVDGDPIGASVHCLRHALHHTHLHLAHCPAHEVVLPRQRELGH